MNEIELADALVDLIEAARDDGPDMLAFRAMSFAQDTMIETIESYTPRFADADERRLEISTRRGDIFLVTVERIRAGVPA